MIDRPVDASAMYAEKRREFVALVRSLSPEQLATMVPATPRWSVRDALAHVVGITYDMNHQIFTRPGGDDAWTEGQVTERRERSIDELAAEWEAEAPQFEEGLRPFGYEFASHYIGDLMHHYFDVLHAVGRAADREDPAVAVSLDFYLLSFGKALSDAGLGAVEVQAGEESFTAGEGAVVARVEAAPFELLRAFGGRRCADEIRALDWDGDVEGVMRLVSRYPLPEESLGE